VTSTVSLFDGQTGDVAAATATTLDAALDGREAVVAAVGALDEDAREDYDRYADRVVRDVEAETEDVADATADDELSSEATAALSDATPRLASIGTAAEALVAAEEDEADDEELEDDGGPRGGHEQRGADDRGGFGGLGGGPGEDR